MPGFQYRTQNGPGWLFSWVRTCPDQGRRQSRERRKLVLSASGRPRKLWLRGNVKECVASETGSARVRSANSLALSVLEAPGPFQEKLGFFGGGEASVERNRWISQDDFRHPHLRRSSLRPQDLRAQQLQESQPASKLPQGTAPGETWLLRACL